VTDLSAAELAKSRKLDPLLKKKLLAAAVVRMYHGEESAQQAQMEFERVFSKGEVPRTAPVWKISGQKVDLVETLADKGIVKSNSEGRRLLEQGGVTFNGKRLTNPEVKLGKGVLKIGKRTFIKIE